MCADERGLSRETATGTTAMSMSGWRHRHVTGGWGAKSSGTAPESTEKRHNARMGQPKGEADEWRKRSGGGREGEKTTRDRWGYRRLAQHFHFPWPTMFPPFSNAPSHPWQIHSALFNSNLITFQYFIAGVTEICIDVSFEHFSLCLAAPLPKRSSRHFLPLGDPRRDPGGPPSN